MIEKHLGIKAKINLLPLQAGDVPDTYADVDDLVQDMGYCPSMILDKGVGLLLLRRISLLENSLI